MSREPVQSYRLLCDRCGDHYESGDFSIFGEDWAVEDEAAHEGDWWCHGYMDDDARGPDCRDLCSYCLDREWVDDDTVLQFTEKPIPMPHQFVRRPNVNATYPGDRCHAADCRLFFKHEVHKVVTP